MGCEGRRASLGWSVRARVGCASLGRACFAWACGVGAVCKDCPAVGGAGVSQIERGCV